MGGLRAKHLHPRETVREWLVDRGIEWIQREYGKTAGDGLFCLLYGGRDIDEEMADILANVTGVGASFWAQSQRDYHETGKEQNEPS